jgi:uncharacterized protein YndB with AHSA1/START domain
VSVAASCRNRDDDAVPTVSARHELLAPRQDVWDFLAEPRHLADWWPGIRGVEPDRRALSPGARWQVRGLGRPSLIRKPDATGTLVVLQVDRLERIAWQFTGDRIDVELRLTAETPDRTLAELDVRGPWLVGLRRSLPRTALTRLAALCQTAAEH